MSSPSPSPRPSPRRRRTSGKSPPGRPPFASLYFGRAAAENEIAEDSERFRSTYFDRWDLSTEVEQHRRFLILGPKGAGKSAAAKFVSLTWASELGPSAVFDIALDFDSLNRTQTPLAALDKKLVSPEITTLTDAAWKLFIGVRLLESLIADPASSLNSDLRALSLLKELQGAGLASDDYPKVLRSVRERKGGFSFHGLGGESTSKETDTISPGQLGDALLTLIINATSPNRHLMAIDGLDKAITENATYWQTLAALIREADNFRTRALRQNARHVFVLVMCRSDVFRRARFADAPKIAADGGIYIDWHAEAANAKDVLLWEYLARKSQSQRNVLFSYLPRSVEVGKQGAVDTLRYLLDFTRYTPRDMSLLFGYLQKESRGLGALAGVKVRAAATSFASQHLLPEMIAEAVGLLPPQVIDRIEAILASLPKRVVTKAHLKKAIADAGVAELISVTDFGEYLFLQGALGNYQPDVGYYQFYHRRDAHRFRATGPWVLHSGLVYAMNIVWSGV